MNPPLPPPPPQPTRVTVLISGSGTNLQALIDARERASRPFTIVRVVSNRRDAYGLTRARNAGIATGYHNLRAYRARFPGDDAAARAAYDADLAGIVLRGRAGDGGEKEEGGQEGDGRPDLVVCAGFMHVLGKVFLDRMREKGVPIINLHPGEEAVPLYGSCARRGHR
jgi:phosphoribosylglycinamide formyltransferase